MTRPTILDLDLVVVPREPAEEMFLDPDDICVNFGESPWDAFKRHYTTMLSASPYTTVWDDVRKYVEGLERERDDSIARETDAWRRANRSESKVKAWEGFVVVRDLPRITVQTKDFGPDEQDTVSVPKITPEKLTDIIDRADAAEARIAELEKRLADAARVIEPFSELLSWFKTRRRKYVYVSSNADGTNSAQVSLAHLRAARAYMEGK